MIRSPGADRIQTPHERPDDDVDATLRPQAGIRLVLGLDVAVHDPVRHVASSLSASRIRVSVAAPSPALRSAPDTAAPAWLWL